MTLSITPIVLSTLQRKPHPGLLESLIHGFGKCILHQDQGSGAAIATQHAIALAVKNAAPSDYILFCEDDVEMHPTAPDRIKNHLHFPTEVHVGVICLCDMREMPRWQPPGIYPRSALGSDGRGWWGDQALLIHPTVASYLASADWFSPDIERSKGVSAHKAAYEDDGKNCSDIRMSLLVHAHEVLNRYAVYVPSLFVHRGDTSTCFKRYELGERETKNTADEYIERGLWTPS